MIGTRADTIRTLRPGNYLTDYTTPEPESDCKSMGTQLHP